MLLVSGELLKISSSGMMELRLSTSRIEQKIVKPMINIKLNFLLFDIQLNRIAKFLKIILIYSIKNF